MELEEQIKLAKEVAQKAHSGEYRNNGKTPYFEHVKAVANAVEDRLKPIAYLHDVIENTNITINDLKSYGFDSYIVSAVDLLTHKDGVTNVEYWKSIATDPNAIKVKLADIQHNLSSNPSEYAKIKYAKAIELFKKLGYSS